MEKSLKLTRKKFLLQGRPISKEWMKYTLLIENLTGYDYVTAVMILRRRIAHALMICI